MTPPDPSRTAQDAIREQLVAAARREPAPSRAAQNAVREQLVAAARREHETARVPLLRRIKRRWRTTGLIAVALLGAAAAAEGTGLISVGDPLPDPVPYTPADDPRFGSARDGGPDLVATASDPKQKTSWGVGIYTATDGRDCVIAGQVRGFTLGLVRDGRFRPYDKQTTGACADKGPRPALVLDRLTVGGADPRTIVFGRTATPERPPVLFVRGTRYKPELGRGGAFLFVFAGRLAPADVTTRPG